MILCQYESKSLRNVVAFIVINCLHGLEMSFKSLERNSYSCFAYLFLLNLHYWGELFSSREQSLCNYDKYDVLEQKV